MEMTWWAWLWFLVSTVCVVLLAVAAGIAFARFRRWSLACLFVAAVLKFLIDTLGLAYVLASLLDSGWISYYLNIAPWPIAVAGAVGELFRLTGMSSQGTFSSELSSEPPSPGGSMS